MKVVYLSHNTGGYWRLDDDDWEALAEAEWTVHWLSSTKAKLLGTKAVKASKTFEYVPHTPEASMKEAILEWEAITGLDSLEDVSDGPPHLFTGHPDEDEYFISIEVEGSLIVPILFGDKAPRTLREALEQLELVKSLAVPSEKGKLDEHNT